MWFRASSNIQIKHQTDATINRKIYCLVTQAPLDMFRALLCPSSGAVYKLTTAGNTTTYAFIRQPEAATG
jgi:hypothetical protein